MYNIYQNKIYFISAVYSISMMIHKWTIYKFTIFIYDIHHTNFTPTMHYIHPHVDKLLLDPPLINSVFTSATTLRPLPSPHYSAQGQTYMIYIHVTVCWVFVKWIPVCLSAPSAWVVIGDSAQRDCVAVFMSAHKFIWPAISAIKRQYEHRHTHTYISIHSTGYMPVYSAVYVHACTWTCMYLHVVCRLLGLADYRTRQEE